MICIVCGCFVPSETPTLYGYCEEDEMEALHPDTSEAHP